MIATQNVQDVQRKKFVDYQAAKKFGRWIRKVREKRGISQLSVAKELGVSLGYWSRVENGQRSIARREDFLHKIAAQLGLDVNLVRKQASPSAKELSADEALRQVESAAAALEAIRLQDKERERHYRYVGNSVMQVLRFARDLSRNFTFEQVGPPILVKQKAATERKSERKGER